MSSKDDINAMMVNAFKNANLYNHRNHAINSEIWAKHLIETAELDNATFEKWVIFYFSGMFRYYDENCSPEFQLMHDAHLKYCSQIRLVTNAPQKD